MMRDYMDSIKVEINKREANKADTGLEWACDQFLQSELKRIQNESNQSEEIKTVETIKDLDERIHSIEIWIRSNENPLDPSDHIQLDENECTVREDTTGALAIIISMVALGLALIAVFM